MYNSNLEKSIIATIDQIEFIKGQIVKTFDNRQKKEMLKTLNKLYLIRSYYIDLIYRR